MVRTVRGTVSPRCRMARRGARCAAAGAGILLAIGLPSGCAQGTGSSGRPAGWTAPAGVVLAGERDLQAVIDAAPPHSTVLCDRGRPVVLATPLRIEKPLVLRGLNARLPEKLGKTPLVVVAAAGVTVADFELTGNGDSVRQTERAPLLVIGAGDFRVERGVFANSSKDGVMIDGDVAGADIVGGVVRDIVGRKVIRDTVSISGSGKGGFRIRNVLVENVRCYESMHRGAVEVSDGTDNITVRKVYAEASVYAVDVQDHGAAGQVNTNVVVEDVYALRCTHAIRTSNSPFGHSALTVRDITAKECVVPIRISNTAAVGLYNVRVIDQGRGTPGCPVQLRNCDGAVVRDVCVENTGYTGPAMVVEDGDEAVIDGFTLRGKNENLGCGVCFHIASDRALSGVRITNVCAPDVSDAGIVLEIAGGKKGTLSRYIVAGNLARVRDDIRGAGARVADNLP